MTLSSSGVAIPSGVLTFTWTVTPPRGSAFDWIGNEVSFTPPDQGTFGISLRVVKLNRIHGSHGLDRGHEFESDRQLTTRP